MEEITPTVLVEGVVVGFLLIVITLFVSEILKLINVSPKVPDHCSDWNKYHIMEITLFISGFLFHILCELFGVNKWYVIKKSKEL